MPTFSQSLEQSLHRALAIANERHHQYATLEHLLLSLIDDSRSGGRLIFLDPHCRQTAEGRSYCQGDKVREVTRRFSQAVVSETAPEPAPSSTPPVR